MHMCVPALVSDRLGGPECFWGFFLPSQRYTHTRTQAHTHGRMSARRAAVAQARRQKDCGKLLISCAKPPGSAL